MGKYPLDQSIQDELDEVGKDGLLTYQTVKLIELNHISNELAEANRLKRIELDFLVCNKRAEHIGDDT